jgi:hypothetical protein
MTVASDELTTNIFRDILLTLHSEYVAWWNGYLGDNGAKVRDFYELINASSYRQIDEKELERTFNSKNFDLMEKRLFLYMKPVEKRGWLAPILALKYNMEGELPEVRLRLGLYVTNQQWETQEAIGFRFETPESEGDGTHNYYHAQMFHSFDKGEGSSPSFSQHTWFPVTQPAFALDAGNPLELLACMLVSLYGPDYVIKQILAQRGQEVKNHLTSIVCLRRPTAPVITSHRANQQTKSLRKVEVRTSPNPIGAKIVRTELYLQRYSDKKFWGGQEWSITKRGLSALRSDNIWTFSNLPGEVPSGRYSLRTVVHDEDKRFNNCNIDVEIE